MEDKEGWLDKRGEAKVFSNFTWKKRYFVLKYRPLRSLSLSRAFSSHISPFPALLNGLFRFVRAEAAQLFYFESPGDLTKPLGFIDLRIAEGVKARPLRSP